uniref:Uncharacterized protein n=1 Tax=Anguilla anguilla TaxID=7936 RepID=A0A0E9WNC8_ANGAN
MVPHIRNEINALPNYHFYTRNSQYGQLNLKSARQNTTKIKHLQKKLERPFYGQHCITCLRELKKS